MRELRHSDDRTAIDDRAAQWLSRRQAGLSPSDEAEFQAWLTGDARHSAAYHELSAVWSALDVVAGTTEGEALEKETEVLVAQQRSRRVRRRWWVAGLAAAAMVALGFFLQLHARDRRGEAEPHVVVAPIGTLRAETLGDGSLLQLNTGSEVSVNFTAPERRVRLVTGEAHFTVAKDPARPFVVQVGEVQIRAIGTAFNVRRREAVVELLVTEGRVQVEAPGATPASAPSVLAAGAFLRVPLQRSDLPAETAISVDEIGMERMLAWRERRLEFEATPLAEVVAELNRYRVQPLVIRDPRLAARKFGGTLPVDDAATLVALLEKSFGVVAEPGLHETVLRAAP